MSATPTNPEVTPAHLSRRDALIQQRVQELFDRGGPVVELRRIIFGWSGTFRRHHLRAAFLRRYPRLDLHPFQIDATLEQLMRWGRVAFVEEDSNGPVYRVMLKRNKRPAKSNQFYLPSLWS